MDDKELKGWFQTYRDASQAYSSAKMTEVIARLFSDTATIKMCHPFGTLMGGMTFKEKCLDLLHESMPDLDRRDMILMAGTSPAGEQWICCMGNYMGTFKAPFLDIPPTDHLAHMRYHEYFKVENGFIVEVQAVWDIPELIALAGAWPMAPQLGTYLCTPAPMSGDGLSISGDGRHAYNHVKLMLSDMGRHPAEGGPELMQLEKYWHPCFNWYGPAGIGACRGISGFRKWHQIPFLRAVPDRKGSATSGLRADWLAVGDYVCLTGWPNMRLTLSGDGWMGIAPAGKEVVLRSLDFWRLQDGLIRENWVLIDLLHLYHQVGVDVLARMRELTTRYHL